MQILDTENSAPQTKETDRKEKSYTLYADLRPRADQQFQCGPDPKIPSKEVSIP